MPLFPSQTMKVELGDGAKETSVNIRTHLIGIYVDGILQKDKNWLGRTVLFHNEDPVIYKILEFGAILFSIP